jgi:hypothetical protein
MSKYSIYNGKFACYECREEVSVLRFYQEEYVATWMCSKKHLSKVDFTVRKSR